MKIVCARGVHQAARDRIFFPQSVEFLCSPLKMGGIILLDSFQENKNI
jgi:hypothetical protein